MARSRAKARLNFSAQGQRSGRCRVNRRAERVSRPAREKKPPPEGLGGGYPLSQTDPRLDGRMLIPQAGGSDSSSISS